MTIIEFSDWLENILKEKNLNGNKLAVLSGLDRGIISRALNRQRMPSPESLIAMATALEIPVVDIFVAAGYIPPSPPESQKRGLLDHMFAALPEEKKDDVLDYVHMKQEQWRKEQAGQSGKPKPVTGELK